MTSMAEMPQLEQSDAGKLTAECLVMLTNTALKPEN